MFEIFVAAAIEKSDRKSGTPPPNPFMAKGSESFAPVAVWNSKRSLAAELRAHPKATQRQQAESKGHPRGNRASKLPVFIAPQLCQSLERPPNGSGWGHEIKFDGYRMQMRVESGSAILRTRKGLDWTEKFLAIAKAGSELADCIVDGEIVALDENGAPSFPALLAALSDGKTDELVFFVFDFLFDKDLRGLTLAARKSRLEKMLATKLSKRSVSVVRFVEHLETAGEAVLQFRTYAMNVSQIYDADEGQPVEMKIELEATGAAN